MFNHILSFIMKWLIFFLFVLSSSTAFGQFTISRKVLDLYPIGFENDSTTGLSGVNIISTDSAYISKTDSIGNFEIIVTDFPVILSFSYPFFQTKELTITDPTDSLVISLAPEMFCTLDLEFTDSQKYGFSMNGGVIKPSLGTELRISTPYLFKTWNSFFWIDSKISYQSDLQDFHQFNSYLSFNDLYPGLGNQPEISTIFSYSNIHLTTNQT